MPFIKIDDISNDLLESWEQFTLNHPNSNFFQSPGFYLLNKESKWSIPIGIISVNNNEFKGVLLGVLLRENKFPDRLFSSRIIVWGGPLVLNDDDELIEDIIKVFTNIYRSTAIYIQFRNLYTRHNNSLFEKYGYKFEDHLDIHIDLNKPTNDLWNDIHSKRRNEIRKAYKCYVEVALIHSIEDFKESYKILKEVYSRAKLPLLPYEYFELAWNKFHENGILKIFGAYFDNKLIGTMYILAYSKTYYDWYAGSYFSYYNKNPNDVLPWEVFKHAQENNINLFDFGGAGHPKHAYGVRDYKLKFGGKLINAGRHTKITKPLIYMISKLGLRIWKILR